MISVRITISRTPDWDFRCFYLFEIILLSHITVPARGKDKSEQLHAGGTSIYNVIVMIKRSHHVNSQHIQDFLEAFFQYKRRYLAVSKKRNP